MGGWGASSASHTPVWRVSVSVGVCVCGMCVRVSGVNDNWHCCGYTQSGMYCLDYLLPNKGTGHFTDSK